MTETRPFVAGLDLATCSGIADGRPGDTPRVWSWDLRDAGKFRPDRFALFMGFLTAYLAETQVDYFFYESAMLTNVAGRIGSSEETQILLRGLIGIAEACAARAKIPVVRGVDVKDVRAHFMGQRTFRGQDAKRMVMDRCRAIGWEVENDNESDAAAIWSYGCGIASPRTAISVTPLFQRIGR